MNIAWGIDLEKTSQPTAALRKCFQDMDRPLVQVDPDGVIGGTRTKWWLQNHFQMIIFWFSL